MTEKVTMIPIPRYKELGVKPIWELVKNVEELACYFPTLEEGKLPDRFFLWGILGTLKRNEWAKLLKDARNRRGKKEAEDKDGLIEIDPDILEKIMSAPTISKSNLDIFVSYTYYVGKGRIAFLLKGDWKKGSGRKEVKQYQANLGVLGQSDISIGSRKSSSGKDNRRNNSQGKMKDNTDNDSMNVDRIPDKSQQLRLTDMGFERK